MIKPAPTLGAEVAMFLRAAAALSERELRRAERARDREAFIVFVQKEGREKVVKKACSSWEQLFGSEDGRNR